MNSKEYVILTTPDALYPYAVYFMNKQSDGCKFWQQCSKSYFYRGWAVRKLKQLMNHKD